MKPTIFLWFFLLSISFSIAQAPQIQWERHYGGSEVDDLYSVIETYDKGFILAGASFSSDIDVIGNHQGVCPSWGNCPDAFLVKLDSVGNMEWKKAYGGTSADAVSCIIQTSDSGFVFSGTSSSNDGDVSGNHGGQGDSWVVKIDKFGNVQWQKCYGGTQYEQATSIIQSTDGGFAFAGHTTSNDGDVSGNHGGADYWVVKIDSIGNLEWQKCLGGSSYDDMAYSIKEALNGGFLIAGGATSIDGDVIGTHYGMTDFWIVQLSMTGSVVWQKSFGGSNIDIAYAIYPTADTGGFVVVGMTLSNDQQVAGNHGLRDVWVAKINSTHSPQWKRCFGGTNYDEGLSVEPTSDGGYFISGYTDSNDGNVSGNHGSGDFWLIKISNSGILEWQKCFGGGNADWAFSGHQTSTGGYVLGGPSLSSNGDVGGNYGQSDYWIANLISGGLYVPEQFMHQIDLIIFNNPDGSLSVKFFSKKNGQAVITLTDVLGRSLIQEEVDTKEGSNTVKLSPNQSDGIYIVNLSGEIGVGVKKFVGF